MAWSGAETGPEMVPARPDPFVGVAAIGVDDGREMYLATLGTPSERMKSMY